MASTAAATTGVFAFTRSVQEEMDWMEEMRRTNPDAAENVMSNSRLFVELAAEGEVRSMMEIVADVKHLPDHVLCYYFVKMFQVAAARRRMDVLKYMLDHGFDARHSFVKDTLHRVIDAATDDAEDTLQPILHLLLAHMDVNFQRPGDLFTPLHVACSKSMFGVASLLILYEADVNAIAADDVMPLNCAERPASPEIDHASKAKLVDLLKEAGARPTWRRQQPPKGEPDTPDQALSSQFKVLSFSSARDLFEGPTTGLMFSTEETD